MVIEQAPPKHVTEQLMPLEALQADEALSLPDQDSPPPETRMFAIALLLSAGMLLLLGAGAMAVFGGG
jgi:hypothetical protein